MAKGNSKSSSKSPMTTSDAARIQSAEAKVNSGKVQSGGFAATAQRAAARNSQKNQ